MPRKFNFSPIRTVELCELNSSRLGNIPDPAKFKRDLTKLITDRLKSIKTERDNPTDYQDIMMTTHAKSLCAPAQELKLIQMLWGDIGEFIISHAEGCKREIGTKGVDVRNEQRKDVTQVKARYNTSNADSMATIAIGLFTQKGYNRIYAWINTKTYCEGKRGHPIGTDNSGQDTVCHGKKTEGIRKLSGDRLFEYIFGPDYQDVVKYVVKEYDRLEKLSLE